MSKPRRLSIRTVIPAAGVAVFGMIVFATAARGQRPEQDPFAERVRRAALNHVAFQDRNSKILLVEARVNLEQGELQPALDRMQELLGDPRDILRTNSDTYRGPVDSLFWENNQLKSVRRETLRLFESLTQAQLAEYEATYGPPAQDALDRALQSGRVTVLQEVMRRCEPTRAGTRAAELVATRLFDRGCIVEAARIWRRLLHASVHRRYVNPKIGISAAAALIQAGRQDEAAELLKYVEDEFNTMPRIGEARVTVSVLQRVLSPRSGTGSTDRLDQWATPFGSVDHNATAIGSTPYLKPVWSRPLHTGQPSALLEDWESELVDEELAEVGAAAWPIVVRGNVVVRDLGGIRSCDSRTGRELWRFDSTLSVPKFVDKIRQIGYGSVSKTPIELSWTANSTLGMVSSDGERVFAVDWLEFRNESVNFETPGAQSRTKQLKLVRASNRLVCLESPDVLPEKGQPAIRVKPSWSVGALPNASGGGVLNGHLFVGPPLPFEESVFIVTELSVNKELHLAKLDATTGQLQWVQPLGIVEQPMFAANQYYRQTPTCIPAISEGLVVCPTASGFIVAVDSMTGELAWLNHYAEVNVTSRGFGGSRFRTPYGFSGFPDPPHIHEGQIVVLPRISKEVLCLDLRTGEKIWGVSREEDHYVATIAAGIVAVVGKTGMRGLSLQNGRQVWATPLGLPSGRGTRIGNRYLLPLKDGGVATIDLESGNRVAESVVPSILDRRFMQDSARSTLAVQSGRDRRLARFGMSDLQIPAEVRPGNLLLHDGLVMSVGPRHLTAFPQSESLLDELKKDADQGRSVDEYLVAGLELTLGLNESAERRLARLIKDEEYSDRERARWLLREMLIGRLGNSGEQLSADARRAMIDQLDSISRKPFEREQVLVEKAQWAVRNGKWAEAAPFAREVADLGLASFTPLAQSGQAVTSTEAWSRKLLRDVAQSGDDSGREWLRRQAAADLKRAVKADSIEGLRRFVELYAELPESSRVRNRLADRLIHAAQYQEAELQLLRNLRSESTQSRAVAEALLISLLTKAALHAEAGRKLEEFSSRYSGVNLSPAVEDRLTTLSAVLTSTGRFFTQAQPTVEDFVASIDRNLETWAVYRSLIPMAWDVRRVAIRKQTFGTTNPVVGEVWRDSPRRVSNIDRSGFHILRRGTTISGQWQLIDRYSGVHRGTIHLPGRVSQPAVSDYRFVGHFMPVGTPAGMAGVSLLEFGSERPLWELDFPPLQSSRALIESGPATPEIVVFQTRKHLIGIDPANGRVQWRRSDLDLSSGIFVDKEAGLFGDERILVMFHADQTSYTTLDPLSGELIGEGKLDIDFRYLHRIYGRKLFHVTKVDRSQSKRIRVWDPLKTEFDLDIPVVGRFYHAPTVDNELVILDSRGRLRGYQMPEMKSLCDIDLGDHEMRSVTAVRVFSDDQNLYVNLQRPGITSQTREYHYVVSDSAIPVINAHQGWLYAIRKSDGRLLWKRGTVQKSFLHLDSCRLPFLVGMSRVRLRDSTSLQTVDIEILDRNTGELIGHSRNIPPDRFVHSRINLEKGILELHGLSSRIDLDFSRRSQRILLEHEPL